MCLYVNPAGQQSHGKENLSSLPGAWTIFTALISADAAFVSEVFAARSVATPCEAYNSASVVAADPMPAAGLADGFLVLVLLMHYTIFYNRHSSCWNKASLDFREA